MRVRPRAVVLSLLGLLVVGALLLLYSRELFGVHIVKNFFLQQLEASLRRKIEVDRIKLVLLPSLRLELSNVEVYGHDDPSHLVFKAKEMDIVLRLLPLLRKQVVAKRLFLDEPGALKFIEKNAVLVRVPFVLSTSNSATTAGTSALRISAGEAPAGSGISPNGV